MVSSARRGLGVVKIQCPAWEPPSFAFPSGMEEDGPRLLGNSLPSLYPRYLSLHPAILAEISATHSSIGDALM